MPKPASAATPQPEKIRTTVFRVVPHIGPDGKPAFQKWDAEEIVISGVVESRKVHESGQSLAVARERHSVLMQKHVNREAPETWK